MIHYTDLIFLVACGLSACVVTLLLIRVAHLQCYWRMQLASLGCESTDAVLWVTDRKTIHSCNRAASQIFGQSKHELRGTAVESVIPSFKFGEAGNTLYERLTRGRIPKHTERMEGRGITADGDEFPVSLTIRNLNQYGSISHVIVIRDNSHLDQAQRELERFANQLLMTKQALEQKNHSLEETVIARTEELRLEKERAESANKAKSDFLANMSHELRTPLHAILSFSRFGLKRGDEYPREKLIQYFRNIENSGNTLLHLVNQLLDIAKLESGTIVLDCQQTQPRILIEKVVEEFQTLATEKGISIRSVFPNELPHVLLDRDKISQVVRNLISNALKVSQPACSIVVCLSSNETNLTVRIVDEGPGIPESELKSIFEKFVQSTRTNTGAGGTGLGLSICQQIVSLHGGKIWAENVRPNGAAISFELPLSEPLAPLESSNADQRALSAHASQMKTSKGEPCLQLIES